MERKKVLLRRGPKGQKFDLCVQLIEPIESLEIPKFDSPVELTMRSIVAPLIERVGGCFGAFSTAFFRWSDRDEVLSFFKGLGFEVEDINERDEKIRAAEAKETGERKNVVVSLTLKQATELSEILWGTEDAGPRGEGWKSHELEELVHIVDQAIASHISEARSELSDIEKAALNELAAQGQISMASARPRFAEVMTGLVEKGLVEVVGLSWEKA